MTLAQILEEIKLAKTVAEEDVEAGAPQTLNARRGRQKRAADALKQLTEQYTRELMRSTVFILTTGSESDVFAQTASDGYGCFSGDPEGFYKDLADRIPPTLYQNKVSVANLFEVVGRHLEDKALEMEVIGYPMLVFKEKYKRPLASKEDLSGLLKEAINSELGSEFAGIDIVRKLSKTAIEKQHTGKTTPVVLSIKDPQLLADFMRDLHRLTPNIFLVVAGKSSKALKSVEGAILLKDGTAESVEKALTTIRSFVRK